MPWHTSPDEYGGLLGFDLNELALPTEDDFVGRYMASLNQVSTLQPFHKAFALYRFAVIFVGIADRAREGNAADPRAKTLVHWRKDSLSGEWKFRREFLMLSEQNFSIKSDYHFRAVLFI